MMKKMSITKQCTAIIFLALCLLLVISYPGNASMMTLKHDSVIADNTIVLGDLFNGLPHSADKVLGPAPRPGQDMVLNARTLMRIAIALDLPWKPQSSAEYVTLRRAATVIDRETIIRTLKDELHTVGLNGNYTLVIPAEKSEIILPASEPGKMHITNIRIDRKNNWFEANVVAPSKDNPIHRSRISGTYEMLVKVPVLIEAMGAGTIIGQRDIEMIDLPERYVSSDMIIEAQKLIGTTPRRLMTAGNPIKKNDVQEPKIVSRGELVTVRFASGPLQLTTRAKALENGARGDTIRIVNVSSNKTLEATVTASQEVTIKTF